jgi:Zn-dependent protease with chaperone function
MSDVVSSVPRPARVDPHALPPATTGRFLLLIATAVASSVQVYAWLVGRLDVTDSPRRACVSTARTTGGDLLPDALIEWYAACSVWASLAEARVVAFMVLVFAAVTVGIYLVLPVRLVRGLTRLRDVLDDDDVGHVARQVERIVAEHADRTDLTVYVDAASGRGVNRAFGRVGRYSVVLDVSLLRDAAQRPDDPRLRSVLLHELAHIRNRDVDLTYLTIASWWGFLVAVALPFLVVAVNAPSALADFSWRLAGLLALMWLVRAAVFRSREYYADVRSVATPADEHDLIRTLRPRGAARLRTRLPGLSYLVYHPGFRDRIATVRTGDRLFRLSPGVAAATGALVGLSYPPVSYFVGMLLPYRQYERVWLCGLVFGLLIGAVLTGSVWRAAVWSLAGGDRRVSTFPSAAAFTGALLGCLVITPRLAGVDAWTTILWRAPWLALALAVLLLGGVHVYLRWCLLCATCWLPVAGRPWRAYRFGVVQSALVVGVWLGAWFEVVNLVGAVAVVWQSLLLALLAMSFNPLLLLSIPWACAYPLVTWQTRRMAARARAYPWWRPGDGERRAIGGTRTPLAAVSVTAAAIVTAYGAAVVPLHADIRLAVERLTAQLHAPASALLPLLRLLVLPALVTTAGCLLVLGLAAGGRGRTSRAVACSGAALLPASIGLFVMMLVHLTTASPIVRDLVTLLSGLSGLGGNGSPPVDRPVNAAIGLMILAVLALSFTVGLPAAVVGSLLRAARPRRGADRAPGRPVWLAVALAVPLVLAGGALGYVGWTEWRVPDLVVVPEAVNHQAVEEVLGRRWPQSLPLAHACVAILNAGVELPREGVRGDIDLVLAHAAGYARSAEDRVLRTMGEGVVEALRRSKLRRAELGVAASIRYCGDALTYT